MEDNFAQFTSAGPMLSFDEEPAPAPAPVLEQAAEQPEPEANGLSEAELKQVDDFVKRIDISNSQAVMNYGAGTQKKMADFTEKALDNARSKDLGEVGDMITSLLGQLKGLNQEEEEKGFLGFFKKGTNKLNNMKAKYAEVETNVTAISNELEKHQIQLMKDVAVLDQMYELNLNYFKELSMYILAGKRKLKQARETELKALQEKAQRTGLQEDAQAARGACAHILYDLDLTRMVAMQTGPQIRMIQNSNTVMAEKIQSTIVNTIPLWKNQMVIAIGLKHSTDAAKAQREVSDMTNELLKKNAESLKIATIESAKEAERGIVDMETLKHTNEMLISTMDEVLTIQSEGKQKRREAEAELAQIEDQLRAKLLEASKR